MQGWFLRGFFGSIQKMKLWTRCVENTSYTRHMRDQNKHRVVQSKLCSCLLFGERVLMHFNCHSLSDLCTWNGHFKFCAFRSMCLPATCAKSASIYQGSSQLSNQRLGVSYRKFLRGEESLRGGCICPRSASSGKKSRCCNSGTEMVTNEVTKFHRIYQGREKSLVIYINGPWGKQCSAVTYKDMMSRFPQALALIQLSPRGSSVMTTEPQLPVHTGAFLKQSDNVLVITCFCSHFLFFLTLWSGAPPLSAVTEIQHTG